MNEQPADESRDVARPDEVLPQGPSAPGGGPGGDLGGLDLSSLLGAAAEMQQQFAEAQEAAAETVLTGVSGGGVVRIEVTGAGEFQSVTIDPAAVDPSDVEMLQDLVLAALHDASRQLQDLQEQSMNTGMSGLGDLLGGGGLGGLFGSPGEQ